MKNYYEILGLTEQASLDEIKKAYRKLAMQHHPDRNQGNKKSEEEFKLINEAYSTLSDKEKKKEYDLKRQMGFSHNTSHTNDFSDFNFRHFTQDDNEDIFSNFRDIFEQFGGGFSRSRTQTTNANKIIRKHLSISFWESILGTKKTFEFKTKSQSGKETKKEIQIEIQAGVQSGQMVQIQLDQNVFILLTIEVQDNEHFVRKGDDLYTELKVPFTTACLGGVINFPHWDGDIEVKIPAGTQPDTILRLKSHGIKFEPHFGDLYLVCKMDVPQNLTLKQKEILQEFEKSTQKENLRSHKKWYDSLKNSWKNLSSKTKGRKKATKSAT
jgi:curved DNA-binding protein